MFGGEIVAADKTPNVNATVQVGTQSVKTDGQGRFQFTVKRAIIVSVTASSFAPVSLPVSINADLNLHIPLESLNLDRLAENDVFQSVTSSDLKIGIAAPFVSIDGRISRYFHDDLGVQRDKVSFDNRNKLVPSNSYNLRTGITTPKATLMLLPPEGKSLPPVAFSYEQAFHLILTKEF